MNICFYVEPLVFHNKPYHYFAWLEYCTKIYNSLKTSSYRNDYNFRFVTSEALAHYGQQNFAIPEDVFISLQQKDIKQDFSCGNTAITRAFQTENCGEDIIAAYGDRLKEKLGDFEPDIIFTFSPAPFFEHAYPNALILHMDNGMLSRTPYPDSLMFDPFGLYNKSFPARFHNELKTYKANSEEITCLQKVRDFYKKHIDEKSPMPPYEEALREHFDKIILLPLQFAGETAFDIHCPFRNQLEYIYHILENTPEDTAILTIEHPTALWVGDYLDEDSIGYLRERFPNFILFEAFRKLQNISQQIIPYVDAVISVSSSLAFQSLLWNKPLISMGNSHIDYFADAHTVDEIKDIDFKAKNDKWDNALAFLLSRYWIVDQDCLNNDHWMHNFLTKSFEKFEKGKMGFDFYDNLSSTETIAQKYIQGYIGNFPTELHYFPSNSGISSD